MTYLRVRPVEYFKHLLQIFCGKGLYLNVSFLAKILAAACVTFHLTHHQSVLGVIDFSQDCDVKFIMTLLKG